MKAKFLLFTGIPCSGKSTLADILSETLIQKYSIKNQRLDGDIIRKDLWRDLGFSSSDRAENLRRMVNLSKLFLKQDIWVLSSFVSPYVATRTKMSKVIGNNFIEIFVKASSKECIKRDVKGMYAKAIKGEILNFTGYSAPYEESKSPELVVDTERYDKESCIMRILTYLEMVK